MNATRSSLIHLAVMAVSIAIKCVDWVAHAMLWTDTSSLTPRMIHGQWYHPSHRSLTLHIEKARHLAYEIFLDAPTSYQPSAEAILLKLFWDSLHFSHALYNMMSNFFCCRCLLGIKTGETRNHCSEDVY